MRSPGSRGVVPKTCFEGQHPRSSLIVLLNASNIIGMRPTSQILTKLQLCRRELYMKTLEKAIGIWMVRAIKANGLFR